MMGQGHPLRPLKVESGEPYSAVLPDTEKQG